MSNPTIDPAAPSVAAAATAVPTMPATTAGVPMNEVLAMIAEEVRNQHCILFLGAGVHYPPPKDSPYEPSYPPDARPPLGKQLAEILARDCQLSNTHPAEMNNLGNLSRIATFHEMKRDRNKLVTAVQNAVGRSTRPSAVVRGLAELDFPLILTTNYDQLYERALIMAGKSPRKGVYDRDGAKATTDFNDEADPAQSPFVFKIHGDIDSPESVVITDEDYIQFTLRMGDRDSFHPVPETFRFEFKRMSTLFIGYSLIDYNLRLLFKTLRWKLDRAKMKAAYSVDLYPDPLIVEQFERRERHVQFIVQDLWTFVPALYRAVKGRDLPL